MRKLLAVIVVLVILILLTPWFAGLGFKIHFYRLVNAINANPQLPIQIQVLEYQTGYLTSHTKFNVLPSGQLQDKLNAKLSGVNNLVIDQTISHGPLVTNAVTNSKTFALGNVTTTISLAQVSSGMIQGDIIINTLCKFNGIWLNQLTIPSLTSSLPNPKVTMQNLVSELNYNLKDNNITYFDVNFSIASLAVLAGDVTFNMNGLSITGSGDSSKTGLWDGTRTLTIGGISYVDDTHNIVANNLMMSGSQTGSLNSYTIVSQMSLDKLQVSNFFLPSIGPVSFRLAFNNLNAQALVDFINLAQQDKMNRGSNVDYKTYSDLALKIITPSSSIDNQFSLVTSSGNIDSTLLVNWTGSTSPNSVPELVRSTNLSLNLSASVQLVNQMIEEAIKQKSAQNGAVTTAPAATTVTTPPGSPTQAATTTVTAPAGAQTEVTTTTAPGTSPQVEVKVTKPTGETETTTTPSTTSTTPPPSSGQDALAQLNAAKMYIETMVDQGYIKVENGNYIVNIKRANGVFTINGKPMPMDMPGPAMPPSSPAAPAPAVSAPAVAPAPAVSPPATE